MRDCTLYICHWSAMQQIVSELPHTAHHPPDSPNGLITHPQEKKDKIYCILRKIKLSFVFFL